jgi:hypothetical protein
MAATKTAKNQTSHNDTPNTPDVSESKIARMKVGELRRELTSRGVKGTEGLKKPELVNKLIKAEVRSAKGGRKKPTSRNNTPNTPEVSESKIARMKASELRTRLARRGVTGTADMKKPELVERFVKAELKSAKNGKTKGRSAKGGRKNPTSRNEEITSTADRPERAGRSLVTTDHEVIRQWAKARRAVPATVAGTHHDGHLGVLQFDFPGYSGGRLVEVSWAEWFEAFDKRRLNFIYQDRRSGGERSNFFQLENPDE